MDDVDGKLSSFWEPVLPRNIHYAFRNAMLKILNDIYTYRMRRKVAKGMDAMRREWEQQRETRKKQRAGK